MRWPVSARRALFRFAPRRYEQRLFSSNPLCLRDEDKPNPIDSSLGDLGLVIKDDYANFKEHFSVPKYAIVLDHGLMGFSELRLAGSLLPGVQYWRGIKEAYVENGIEPIVTKVPMTGSIQQRAEALHHQIQERLDGEHKEVNIIARKSFLLYFRLVSSSQLLRSLTNHHH